MRAILAVLLFVLILSPAAYSQAMSTLDRDTEAVVLKGIDLIALLGADLNDVVGFKYEGGWIQIPVQIDERKLIDFGIVLNRPPLSLLTTAYVDPNTYVGADPTPTFDADDELVFMMKDAGGRVPPTVNEPPGTVPALSVQIIMADPVDAGLGFIYLFRSLGALDPAAGADYVSYTFNLLAGTYIPNYNNASGPNPEASTASTAYYSVSFTDRWVKDEMRLFDGGATGVDILDRHRFQFAPGNCIRTEDTFSLAPGAFAANIDGPVRAIRSVLGANSGLTTQRDHYFYEQREEVVTKFRVPAIPGMLDVHDYSIDAVGMTYENNLMGGTVPVDGVQDVVANGPITWEVLDGPQGGLIVATGFQTNIGTFAYDSFYSDDAAGQFVQCSGDASEYATSGAWVTQSIPTTDPFTPGSKQLTGLRVMGYGAPGVTAADAQDFFDRGSTDLNMVINDYVPTDIIELSGDTAGMVGSTVSYTINSNFPAAAWALLYSRFLNGRVIQGQTFDIGSRIRIAAQGTLDAGGDITWVSTPLPMAAGGRTFHVEARVDAGMITYDSNFVTLVIAP